MTTATTEPTVPERDAILATLLDAVAEESAAGEAPEITLILVETVVDALVGMAVLVLPDRWEEHCHRCEQRVGDHTVDGRCPA